MQPRTYVGRPLRHADHYHVCPDCHGRLGCDRMPCHDAMALPCHSCEIVRVHPTPTKGA